MASINLGGPIKSYQSIGASADGIFSADVFPKFFHRCARPPARRRGRRSGRRDVERSLEISAREKDRRNFRSSRSNEENDEGGDEPEDARDELHEEREKPRKVSLLGLQHPPCLQNLASSAPSRCEIRVDELAVSFGNAKVYLEKKSRTTTREFER
ncbi:unnamed protein product [Lasius platythorax]|uniref:Uncharacterized protein n=1 Tax=Lasius platythorax TaxID=488582 RepID=A0AAV2NTQ3_9HYME